MVLDTLFNIINHIILFSFTYFTAWMYLINFIFIIGVKYFNYSLIGNFYFDISFLNILVSVSSIILVYIYPRRFKNKYLDLSGYKLMIMDFFVHHIPTLFMLLYFRNCNLQKNYLIFIFVIYFLIFNVQEKYNFPKNKAIIILIIMILLYLYIPIKKLN